jgi:hypothetical protein
MILLLLRFHGRLRRYREWDGRSLLVAMWAQWLMRWIERAFNWKGLTMAEADKMPKLLTPTRLLYLSLGFVAIPWVIVLVIGCVKGVAPVDKRGQFGDSFGVISCLFTGLAFVGAGAAAYLQREQLIEQRREIHESGAAEKAREVETRFFNLLASLRTAVNETRADINGYVGTQAIRHMSFWLRDLKPCRKIWPDMTDAERQKDIHNWFQLFYDGESCDGVDKPVAPAVDLLGHIFRLIYHILRYVHASKSIDQNQKNNYAGMLRAHLSNPELVLLFYNSFTEHGFEKHFPLLAKYRMFKNMSLRTYDDDEVDWALFERLVGKLPPEFQPPPDEPEDHSHSPL